MMIDLWLVPGKIRVKKENLEAYTLYWYNGCFLGITCIEGIERAVAKVHKWKERLALTEVEVDQALEKLREFSRAA